MSSMLFVLSFYYACDAAAAQMALNPEEALACQSAYTQIKEHFAPEDSAADPRARLREGYLAFKAWEVQNPKTVSQLRDGAI